MERVLNQRSSFSESSNAWFALSPCTQPHTVCKCSIQNNSHKSIPPCSKAPVPCFRLWSTSSSVLQLRQTHKSFSSTTSIRHVTSIYWRNAYSWFLLLVLTPFLNNRKTYATHRPLLSSPWPETSTKQSFFSPDDPKPSVSNILCSSHAYVTNSQENSFLRNIPHRLKEAPAMYSGFRNISHTFVYGTRLGQCAAASRTSLKIYIPGSFSIFPSSWKNSMPWSSSLH